MNYLIEWWFIFPLFAAFNGWNAFRAPRMEDAWSHVFIWTAAHSGACIVMFETVGNIH